MAARRPCRPSPSLENADRLRRLGLAGTRRILGLRLTNAAPSVGQAPGRTCVRTIVKGKNAEVPERVRDYAERKLKRIERLLDDRTDATVELWSEQHRSAADTHFAEVTLV